jgi:hypothetical protein
MRRFGELSEQEPRLAALERDIQAVKDTGGAWFCANDHWYLRFKPQLMKLVGWGAEQPELRTCEAYDVAYDTLLALLPDCRECPCIQFERAIGLRPARRRPSPRTFVTRLIPSTNGAPQPPCQ